MAVKQNACYFSSWSKIENMYRKVASSRLVCYLIWNSFCQRSQYVKIKFPLHKQSENPWIVLLTKTVYCSRLYGIYYDAICNCFSLCCKRTCIACNCIIYRVSGCSSNQICDGCSTFPEFCRVSRRLLLFVWPQASIAFKLSKLTYQVLLGWTKRNWNWKFTTPKVDFTIAPLPFLIPYLLVLPNIDIWL